MTRMEELLRTAIREDSAEIGPADIRPLKLNAVPYPRRAGAMRRLARLQPVFAAAALVLIVTLSLTVNRAHGGGPRPAASPRPSASATGTNTNGGIVGEAIPSEYAAVTAAHGPAYSSPDDITIRDTYSAAVLATVRPPAGYGTFAFVTGGGRLGEWIAGAQRGHPEANADSAAPVKLYLLSYDPGSRRATLRPLPPPPMSAATPGNSSPAGHVTTWLAAVALSNDATRIAAVIVTPAGFDVCVYTLASGTLRYWSAPPPAPQPELRGFSLTWLYDGRTLAIATDFDSVTSPANTARAWYLDTSAPGGELAAASRSVTLTFPKAKPSTSFTGPHAPAACRAVPIATSDGRLLLCSGTANFPVNPAGAASVGIWVFSARTGTLTAALEQREICCMLEETQFPRLLWASPDGGTLIVTGITDANRGTQLFVRAPDRRTQIPWPGGLIQYPGIGNLYEPDVSW